MLDTDGGPDQLDDAEASAYRCLWLGVLKRAQYDAEGRDMMLDNGIGLTVAKREAKRFLMGLYKTDLAIVCHLAGIGSRMDEFIELHRRKYGMPNE